MLIDMPKRASDQDEPKGTVSLGANLMTKERDKFTPIVREYVGDVERTMGEEGIVITNLPASDGFSVGTARYLLIVLGEEEDDEYLREVSTVTHDYSNRKLSVSGDSSKFVYNEKFLKTSGLELDDVKKSTLVASINGNDVPIVYLKGVSYKGEVYEWTAKSNTKITVGRVKDIKLDISRQFDADLCEYYFQDTHRTVEYPISESTVIYSEIFSKIIKEIKGDVIRTYYRRIIDKKIFSFTEYEIDKKSDISTMQYVKSPFSYNFHIQKFQTFDKDSDSSKNPLKLTSFSSGDKFITELFDPSSEAEHMLSIRGRGGKASFIRGSHISISELNGPVLIEGTMFIANTKLNVLSGRTTIGELSVDGNLFVSAENIILSAEKSISEICDNRSSTVKGMCYFSSEDSIIMSVSKDNDSSTLYLSDELGLLISKTAIMYGEDTIYAFAKETGAFGAKKASFFGGNI
jgi:hypothetical protein